MGEGEGAKDVSDQITDEDQLLGARQKDQPPAEQVHPCFNPMFEVLAWNTSLSALAARGWRFISASFTAKGGVHALACFCPCTYCCRAFCCTPLCWHIKPQSLFMLMPCSC